MTIQAIYETKGRAREYSELALNHYRGCGHGCLYCYAPTATHSDRAGFYGKPGPRLTEVDIQDSAAKFAQRGEKRRVLLSFVTDPYQPCDEQYRLTRAAVIILHEHGLYVTILTKGGNRSMVDFDLLGAGDAYATTLTLANDRDSLTWEPNAAPPSERVEALRIAHQRGIETWVSLEPVVDPGQTRIMVTRTKGFTGHYKLGPMNYHEQAAKIDWGQYGWSMLHWLDTIGVRYYFKRDLLKKMKVDPQEFKQTWECG